MVRRRLPRALAALLLVALLAVVGGLPALTAPVLAPDAVDHAAAIGGDEQSARVVRTGTPGAARLRLLGAVPAAGVPDVVPAVVPVDETPDSSVRPAGRQFDARVAQRAPPRT